MFWSSLRSRDNAPSSSAFKAGERNIQMPAFRELLRLRSRSNNKLKRGDMKAIIDGYHSCKTFCVTRQNLVYRMKLYDIGISGLLSDNLCQPVVVDESPPVETIQYDEISSVTLPFSYNSNEQEYINDNNGSGNESNMNEVSDNNFTTEHDTENSTNVPELNFGGRKKGTTNASKKQNTVALKNATNFVATKYHQLKVEAKAFGRQLKDFTLDTMIHETVLPPFSLNNETIKTQVKRNNTIAFSHQKSSPEAEIHLHWDYKIFIVDVSMPNYVTQLLQRFEQPMSSKPQHSPHIYTPPQHGAKVELTLPPVTSRALSAKQVERLQQIVGCTMPAQSTLPCLSLSNP
jgi:hypothetical protein